MPETINNTQFSEDQIKLLPLIGKTVNKWRGRNITLLQHPSREDYVVSVGITFDGSRIIICEEPKSDWAVALDYIAHGKVYVRE